MARENTEQNVVPLTPRYADGWRSGKPQEDPQKTKAWGRVVAKPSEYLVHMRGGRVIEASSGQGASCFKLPGDSVAIVPTSLQRLQFTADQVTQEKVGVQVTGLAVYRIAEPLLAYRMLNFSFPERASEKLAHVLQEMFVGAARRLVANLTVEACLTHRKEGIAQALLREIAPVVSGSGKPVDRTDRGWGVVLDTIEIQDVRVLSEKVFLDMQARFRQGLEAEAREAQAREGARAKAAETEAQRQVALAAVASEAEVRGRKQEADERAKTAELATRARLAEQELEQARQRALARVEVAQAERQAAEAELEVARLRAEVERLDQELAFAKRRAERELENWISPEAISLAVAQKLPELAAAFQQKLGTINVTAIDGANPFGVVAGAVEGVLALARSAGLTLPAKPPREEP